MARFRFLPLAAACIATAALALGTPASLSEAGPDDEKRAKDKAAPKGPTYRNKSLGVRTSGPAGWRMVADKLGAVSNWKRLATWNGKDTDGQAVLYTRPRSAASLAASPIAASPIT